MTREEFIQRLIALDFYRKFSPYDTYYKKVEHKSSIIVLQFELDEKDRIRFFGRITEQNSSCSLSLNIDIKGKIPDPIVAINRFYTNLSCLLNDMNCNLEKMKEETQCDKPVFYPRSETKTS
jgi:hypothetical protein